MTWLLNRTDILLLELTSDGISRSNSSPFSKSSLRLGLQLFIEDFLLAVVDECAASDDIAWLDGSLTIFWRFSHS